jgi:type I restriction enzyme, R subunit
MAPTHHPDSEAALEEATLDLFAQLGWQVANCFHEIVGHEIVGHEIVGHEIVGDGATIGRDSRSQVILRPRLRAALVRLNPTSPAAALDAALAELGRDRSLLTPDRANQEIYHLLKEGVKVTHRTADGEDRVELVRVIDWTRPDNNDFFMAQQLRIAGEVHNRRPDLIGFVNGLPLLFIELKSHHRRLRDAYEHNFRDYRDTIPHLFWYNARVLLSNGSDGRLGSHNTPWRHFARWKKIDDEGEKGVIALETLVRATCTPARLLDIVENFTLFSEGRGKLEKIIAKNHQYLGVNNAIEAVRQRRENDGRLGVFWHTQGSGKSYSMIFFAQKILRRLPGNWTFVVITDRTDLDDQIYQNFANAGAVTEPEKQVRAQSGQHLQQLLREDHRYVFTLIHKFHTEPGQQYPVLSERDDIIVMTDEAHRSQYDILAQNMRDALPNAAFIGFTGTPLMADEEKTRAVFGDYVSIYNFKQSILDGATVPLYYENRIPEVRLTNEQLNADMERLLEEAELDEAQERKLAHMFRQQYHLITRDDRLEKIAADIVYHFLNRGFRGKGMVVSIDKLTAGRLFDKVQRHWQTQLAIHRADWESLPDGDERDRLAERIGYMAETDMALIISEGQNEVQLFREKGLDILPHRRRLKTENLDEKFKDPDDPLRLVFVCAMWMTGFDVPSCATIYLDKPMRNHTLMQTIARANRVFPDKNNGLIVDYIGVFRNLQEALAIYGTVRGEDGEEERPIADKDALVADLETALADAAQFCTNLKIDLERIAATSGFERIGLMDDAQNAILVNDATRRHFLALAGQVHRLFHAILPDPRAPQFYEQQQILHIIAQKIRADDPEGDVTAVMGQVEALLDRSIAAEGYVIQEPGEIFNLGQIDFDALREQFRRGRKNIEANKLRGQLNSKIRQMVRLNPTRIDYLAQLQQLIDAYNAGRLDVDLFFEKLLLLAQSLSDEEQRGIAENLSEEELALFDLLLKPRIELSKTEMEQVKRAARDLLDTLKAEKLVLDWRKRQQTRAQVVHTIETVLDSRLPPVYDAARYEEKCRQIYDHIYQNYYGAGQSVYGKV